MAICWQIPHRCSQGERKKQRAEKKNKQHAIVLDYKWKQLQRRYNIGWPTRRSVHFHCVHCVQWTHCLFSACVLQSLRLLFVCLFTACLFVTEIKIITLPKSCTWKRPRIARSLFQQLPQVDHLLSNSCFQLTAVFIHAHLGRFVAPDFCAASSIFLFAFFVLSLKFESMLAARGFLSISHKISFFFHDR